MIIKEITAKSIISKSNLPVCEYAVNPYVGCTHACKYCYASFMKRFTNHPEPWGEFLDVKYWDKIKNPKKYAGRELFIGSVTDPYNPQEEVYGRTRTLLTELKGSGAKLSIATKSDLIMRDLDLIKDFPDVRVSWSINTLDETFKDDMDKAVSVERRFAAMKAFHRAGVRTTCFISPVFPMITDVKAIIGQAKEYCNLIWLENLNLRGSYTRKVIILSNKVYVDVLAEFSKDGLLIPKEITWEDGRKYEITQVKDRVYEEYKKYVTEHDKAPDLLADEPIVEAVLDKINEAQIWIPDGEIYDYYRRKKPQLQKRLDNEKVIKFKSYVSFYKSIVDQDRASVVICNLKHEIIYMNPAAVISYAKRGGDKLIGRSLLDCHNPESRDKIQQVVDWFAADESHNIVYIFHNEKQNKDVYMVALRDEGKLIGYYEKHEYRNSETMKLYDLW